MLMFWKKCREATADCSLFFFLLLLALIACEPEKKEAEPVSVFQEPGFFIVNEGPFQSGTGTIDFYYEDKDSLLSSVFQQKNNFPLGNIVQSVLSLDARYMYIVVNNANKIEIVNQQDFSSLNTIENIQLPRYIQPDAGKLYVSSWDNSVKVFALGDSVHLSLKKEIPAGTGPEKMWLENHTLWVLNQGGFDIDSTVSIIDTQEDVLVKHLAVYPKPTGIVSDYKGRVWIMCSGRGWNGISQEDDSEAHLLCVDAATLEITKDLAFPDEHLHPVNLIIDPAGKILYYIYPQGVMSQEVDVDSLQMKWCWESPRMLYGIGVFKNDILVSDPLNFNQRGRIYRISADGQIVDSLISGIIPGNFFVSHKK